jgi:hypothetical protein
MPEESAFSSWQQQDFPLFQSVQTSFRGQQTSCSKGLPIQRECELMKNTLQWANIVKFIKLLRLRWCGHTERLSYERIFKKVTTKMEQIGKGGRPQKRRTYEVEEDLKIMGIIQWHIAARNQKKWKRTLLEAKVQHKMWWWWWWRRRRGRGEEEEVKVKLSLYTPNRPLGFHVVEAPRISTQLVHKNGKVISTRHWLPLPARRHPWCSFVLVAEFTPGP